MKKILSLLFASLAFSLTLRADEKLAVSATAALDVSGIWNVTVETDNGPGSPVFTFKQDGEKLTGTYQGAFGEAPVTGTLKGNEIKFSVKVNAQGEEINIEYVGTVEGASIKGKVEFGSFGEGTFTGKKQAK